MASIKDLDEGDWREMLAELRLMVVSAGFIQWDTSMASSLDEDEDRGHTRGTLIRYAKGFAEFLAVRSRRNLARMRRDLSELIRTEKEQPVNNAVIRDDERGELISLFAGPPSDALIKEFQLFVSTVLEDTGYFDDSEREE